jgi:hypothetical protein
MWSQWTPDMLICGHRVWYGTYRSIDTPQNYPGQPTRPHSSQQHLLCKTLPSIVSPFARPSSALVVVVVPRLRLMGQTTRVCSFPIQIPLHVATPTSFPLPYRLAARQVSHGIVFLFDSELPLRYSGSWSLSHGFFCREHWVAGSLFGLQNILTSGSRLTWTVQIYYRGDIHPALQNAITSNPPLSLSLPD